MPSHPTPPMPIQTLSAQGFEQPVPLPLDALETAIQSARADIPSIPEPLHRLATSSHASTPPIPTLGQAMIAADAAPEPIALEKLIAIASTASPIPSGPVPLNQLGAKTVTEVPSAPQPLERLAEAFPRMPPNPFPLDEL